MMFRDCIVIGNLSSGRIQGVPKVKCKTLGNGYLGQNKEKIKNKVFPKMLRLRDIRHFGFFTK
jgi:hypothetical protein